MRTHSAAVSGGRTRFPSGGVRDSPGNTSRWWFRKRSHLTFEPISISHQRGCRGVWYEQEHDSPMEAWAPSPGEMTNRLRARPLALDPFSACSLPTSRKAGDARFTRNKEIEPQAYGPPGQFCFASLSTPCTVVSPEKILTVNSWVAGHHGSLGCPELFCCALLYEHARPHFPGSQPAVLRA